jgi:hypothetical protein
MKARFSRSFLAVLAAVSFSLMPGVARAVTARDYAINLTVSTQRNPPQITLEWPAGNAARASVRRKTPSDANWTLLEQFNDPAGRFVDTDVQPGVGYEYRVDQSAQVYQYAFVYAGIDLPLAENRGGVLLLVDDTIAAPLSTELARLEEDLAGDGWTVVRRDVSRTGTVAATKALIVSEFNRDPEHLNTVFLFGHVPVPYSGLIAPDGHTDHYGAWPADIFYGDVDGTWTDISVNNAGASRAANRNVPGDGKYDQSSAPSKVELSVGRVDLSNMPAFGKPEVELLRRYLNKDHAYRHKQLVAEERGLSDDNFGDYINWVSKVAWWTYTALMGWNSMEETSWFPAAANASYLWGYGCGGGSYQGASGIGSTTDFATKDPKVIFTFLFGSYFGDWDSGNNFLRAPLATNWGLSCVWAGWDSWMFHLMGLGEPLASAVPLMQNNALNGYPYNTLGGANVYIALMGDPTLRIHVMAPATDVAASSENDGVHLRWTASPDAGLGYHVYRAATRLGPFTRLTAAPVNAETYLDTSAPAGGLIYVVRAVTRQVTPTGTFFNGSQGAFVSITRDAENLPNEAPELRAPAAATAFAGTPLTLGASAADDGRPLALQVEWTLLDGPAPVTFADAARADATVIFDEPGAYRLRLRAFDGDKAAEAVVIVTVRPPLNAAAGVVVRNVCRPDAGQNALFIVPAGAAGPLRVRVYDRDGRLVRGLHDGPASPGEVLEFDGRDDGGAALPAGVYTVLFDGAVQSELRAALLR